MERVSTRRPHLYEAPKHAKVMHGDRDWTRASLWRDSGGLELM